MGSFIGGAGIRETSQQHWASVCQHITHGTDSSSVLLKVCSVISNFCRAAGRHHSNDPTTSKLRQPIAVRALGTCSTSIEADLKWWRPEAEATATKMERSHCQAQDCSRAFKQQLLHLQRLQPTKHHYDWPHSTHYDSMVTTHCGIRAHISSW